VPRATSQPSHRRSPLPSDHGGSVALYGTLSNQLAVAFMPYAPPLANGHISPDAGVATESTLAHGSRSYRTAGVGCEQ
jgi:hypothetical protein